jgi:glycolate oxidase FAD binding subunit
MIELRPTSETQLVEALADCAASRRTIQLGGHFSKDELAGRVEADASVSLCAMRRVLQYEPRDLTISVEAGLPWTELCDALAANRQMVPLDPPWFSRCTVGGVVAANMSGPRRRLYGTARDVVIGMRFCTLEGKAIQTGGMVVKNVAGLDMAKLMIGSWGTLAAVSVVNFKLAPMPEGSRSFLAQFETAAEVMQARDAALRSTLQPVAIDVLNPEGAGVAGLDAHYTVLLQAQGTAAVLDRYSREWGFARVVDDKVWDGVREWLPRTRARRVVASLTGLADVVARPEPVLARAGSGVAYVAGAADEAPRPSLEIMKRVKDLFDPDGLLNPGRIHDGF